MTKYTKSARIHAIKLVADVAYKCQEQMLSYQDYTRYAKNEPGGELLSDVALHEIWTIVEEARVE